MFKWGRRLSGTWTFFSVLVWLLQHYLLAAHAQTDEKPSLRILPVLAIFINIDFFDTESCIGNMTPNYYISMFEGKLGIIFACGPAVRQFWAYRTRMRTCLPTEHRQYPNEDFEKMRFRINLRDIIWYRKPQVVGTQVFDASRIFRSRSPPPDTTSGNPQKSSQVRNSALDAWEKRVQKLFPPGHHKAVRADERRFHHNSMLSTDNELGKLWFLIWRCSFDFHWSFKKARAQALRNFSIRESTLKEALHPSQMGYTLIKFRHKRWQL